MTDSKRGHAGLNQYDHPNATWICGDRASPCPFGPTASGICGGFRQCQPVYKNGRWQCNRPTLMGGCCSNGPLPNGKCGLPDQQCSPRRSWRKIRRDIFIGSTVVLLLAVVTLLASPLRSNVVVPGRLSASHERALNSVSISRRCQRCHFASEVTTLSANWLANKFVKQNVSRKTQTAKCLECHAEKGAIRHAMRAHGVPLNSVDDVSLHCADCHREHRADSFLVSANEASLCLSCHQDDFDQWNGNHPSFAWQHAVYADSTRFDHRQHANQYFPEARQAFDCRGCHRRGADDVQRTVGYESCQQCHEQSLRSNAATDMTLFQIPSFDVSEWPVDLRTSWPVNATGFNDGIIEGWMQLILLGDPAYRKLGRSGLIWDLQDLQDNSQYPQRSNRFAKMISEALRRLARSPSRLWPTNEAQSQPTVANVAELLPQQLIFDAYSQWFASPSESDDTTPTNRSMRDVTLDRNGSEALDMDAVSVQDDRTDEDRLLLTDESSDLLVDDFAASSGQESSTDMPRFIDVDAGWYRDDLAMAIRYRTMGHDDVMLHRWIEWVVWIGQNTSDASVQDAVQSFQQQAIVAQCLSCHELTTEEVTSPTRGVASSVDWKFSSSNDWALATGFRHVSHLKQQTCDECHRVDQRSTSPRDFLSITKADCISCHRKDFHSDSCTLCHKYHWPSTAKN